MYTYRRNGTPVAMKTIFRKWLNLELGQRNFEVNLNHFMVLKM
jgi:hypothetical protein